MVELEHLSVDPNIVHADDHQFRVSQRNTDHTNVTDEDNQDETDHVIGTMCYRDYIDFFLWDYCFS